MTRAFGTLHLVCGLPGSGKTTLACQLERELPALRLSPDEWILALDGDPYDESLRSRIEALQWTVASGALIAGSHVILEWGFWSKKERLDLRARAAAWGASTKLHVLDVALEELQRRITARNATASPATVPLSLDDLEIWWKAFERPTPDELE